MKSCVIERIQGGENEVIDELLVTINKLMKVMNGPSGFVRIPFV